MRTRVATLKAPSIAPALHLVARAVQYATARKNLAVKNLRLEF